MKCLRNYKGKCLIKSVWVLNSVGVKIRVIMELVISCARHSCGVTTNLLPTIYSRILEVIASVRWALRVRVAIRLICSTVWSVPYLNFRTLEISWKYHWLHVMLLFTCYRSKKKYEALCIPVTKSVTIRELIKWMKESSLK